MQRHLKNRYNVNQYCRLPANIPYLSGILPEAAGKIRQIYNSLTLTGALTNAVRLDAPLVDAQSALNLQVTVTDGPSSVRNSPLSIFRETFWSTA